MVGAAAAKPGNTVRFLGCLPLGFAAAAYAASTIHLSVPEPIVDIEPFRVSLMTLAGGVQAGADPVHEMRRLEPVEPLPVAAPEPPVAVSQPRPEPVPELIAPATVIDVTDVPAAQAVEPVAEAMQPTDVAVTAFAAEPAPRKPMTPEMESAHEPQQMGAVEPIETAMADPVLPIDTIEDRGTQRSDAEADDGGQDASTVIREADYLHQVAPVYPRRAVELAQQGTVIIHAHVLADGSPGELRIAESSGFRLLDRAAVAAVEKWRFVPRADDGSAVADWVRVPVRFVIEN